MEAAKSFFALAEGVAENISAKPIAWHVEVDKGSTVLRLLPDNPTRETAEAVEIICRGVRSLRSGIKNIPYGFTKREVQASRNLAALIDGTDVKYIAIQNGGEPEEMPQTLIEIADAILVGEAYSAFGSIEGIMDSMSLKHGFICSVQDANYRREITCYFQKEEITKEAINGFGKRVLVGGLIRYAKEGHPTSISADSIRIFPDESELPTIEEVQALFK